MLNIENWLVYNIKPLSITLLFQSLFTELFYIDFNPSAMPDNATSPVIAMFPWVLWYLDVPYILCYVVRLNSMSWFVYHDWHRDFKYMYVCMYACIIILIIISRCWRLSSGISSRIINLHSIMRYNMSGTYSDLYLHWLCFVRCSYVI